MKVQIKRLDSVTHNDTTATKLINDNFKAIQDEIELHLSRDGKEPNFMDADLDMNAHRIINSAYPTEDVDVATKEYVDDVAGHAAEYAAQASASAARAAVSEQHAAVYAQVAEESREIVEGLLDNDDFRAVAEDMQSEDSSIRKTADNIEDIHKAALLDPESIEKAGEIGEHISEILPLTGHLNEIDTVSANIASVNTVGNSIANVNKVAAVDESVEVVAANIGSVNTVSTNIGNVNKVAPNVDKLTKLDDDVEQLLKQINGEGGLDSMVSGANVTQASTAARGTAQIATDDEARAGTNTSKFVTPYQLKNLAPGGGGSVPDASETTKGIIRIATLEEAVEGVDSSTAMTPANVKTIVDTVENVLNNRIDEIELFKFPNAVIRGEPTINNGQVSDFSTVSYLQFPFIMDFRDQAFQVDFSFTTATNVQTQQNILDSNFGIALAIQGGKGVMAISSDGSSWNIGSVTGSINIQSNTTYYARLVWNKLQYKTFLSTDGVNYTQDMTITSATHPYPRTIFIGGCDQLETGHTPHPFLGTINMNKATLSVNGQVIWQGMDDAGLATRADISLSNLDEEGQAKFDAKADVSALDGAWQFMDKTLVSSGTLTRNTMYTYDLSDIIPDDGLYECVVSMSGRTGSAVDNSIVYRISLNPDVYSRMTDGASTAGPQGLYACTQVANKAQIASNVVHIYTDNKKIKLNNTGSTNATSVYVTVRMVRKVH